MTGTNRGEGSRRACAGGLLDSDRVGHVVWLVEASAHHRMRAFQAGLDPLGVAVDHMVGPGRLFESAVGDCYTSGQQ